MEDEELPASQQAMRSAFRALESDTTLSAAEKAVRRQQIMTQQYTSTTAVEVLPGGTQAAVCRLFLTRLSVTKPSRGEASTLAIMDEALKCAFCFNLCERPVTVRSFSTRSKLKRLPGVVPAQLLSRLLHKVGATE